MESSSAKNTFEAEFGKNDLPLYLITDVLIEPDHIEVSPRILQIHMIKRFRNEQNVPYLQFFKMATDEMPFFIKLYG